MLSLFHIPQSVLQRLDKVRRNFLWHGNNERKGFHLVKWKNIIRSKEQGGLGIKNLKSKQSTQGQVAMEVPSGGPNPLVQGNQEQV